MMQGSFNFSITNFFKLFGNYNIKVNKPIPLISLFSTDIKTNYQNLSLISGSLTFRNYTLFQHTLNILAKISQTTPSALRTSMINSIQQMPDHSLLQVKQVNNMFAHALTKFMEFPKNLTITAQPHTPTSFYKIYNFALEQIDLFKAMKKKKNPFKLHTHNKNTILQIKR